jgi:phosphoserine phosphatase
MDGTLLPATLGVLFLRELHGHTSPPAVAAAVAEVERYHRNEIDLDTAAPCIYRHYAAAMKGVPAEAAQRAAETVWRSARPLLFDFVDDLLALLRRRSYTTILISGSPQEVIAHAAADLGVQAARGVTAQIRNGRYTGRLDLVPGLPGGKRAAFDDLTGPLAPDLPASLAIGDSSSDAEIFHRVGLPVAFEPDPALRALAVTRHWIIADRRTLLSALRDHLPRSGPYLADPRETPEKHRARHERR